MALWTLALAIKLWRVNAGVKNCEGCAIENHPVAGKASNHRWRCVSNPLLLRLVGSGSHEHNEVEDAIAEENVKAAAHPERATGKSNLPEVFAVGVTSRPHGGKYGRNPDDEDADMKPPNELAAGYRNSCENHAMRPDAEG